MTHVILRDNQKKNKDLPTNVGMAEFQAGLDALMEELHRLIGRHSSTINAKDAGEDLPWLKEFKSTLDGKARPKEKQTEKGTKSIVDKFIESNQRDADRQKQKGGPTKSLVDRLIEMNQKYYN